MQFHLCGLVEGGVGKEGWGVGLGWVLQGFNAVKLRLGLHVVRGDGLQKFG